MDSKFKNLFKKLTGASDEGDDFETGTFDDDYYGNEIKDEYDDMAAEEDTKAGTKPARKEEPMASSIASPEKVSIKLVKPIDHGDGAKIADKLMEKNIVVLDISGLDRAEMIRLIDFLAGGIYVLGGEMIRTNRNTIVVAPKGVDITGFANEESEEEEPATADRKDSEDEI